ncbi:MAG: hypothetical protein A3J58_02180 [Candidatus Sungbacteria bacterium RIFCSPHIGHO2_02_FULL_52_23]|uniref:FIST domain-containing protein n=1 Tax=Candidatus Sungbacteria bacterium RIFCSPHIGHO2_02_FULL_52_23 TaxID=1802274 RepID=A0A1G2KV06_9BACT|nr:MAG: hypothetical protein A3J58_02180 [Candidatus Sungbacteria bacterium RIFCSPHIGHO2_02_FULL_52_23]
MESQRAGREAAEEAMKNLKVPKADAAVVLASSVFNQAEMLAGIREVTGDIPTVGCTAAGVITNSGPHEQAVAVLLLQSDVSSFHPIKIEKISQDMRKAGAAFGDAVKSVADGKAKMALIFSDALSGNGTELVRGVLTSLGAQFPLVGGAAGDDMNFKQTFQYFNGEALNDAAVGLAIGGEMKLAVGADHGWQPFGTARTVTKAKGTTLFELDGKPAFSIYEDYFGKRASDFKSALSLAAVSYPLGMKIENVEGIMIRVPLKVNDDGSIVCGAEVLEGSTITLMIGTVSSALWAAKDTSRKLSERVKDARPKVIFVSDCVARKILYGERGNEEIQEIRTQAGEAAELFGFYSYGQIAPLGESEVNVNTCDPGFYEQSISLAIFGE